MNFPSALIFSHDLDIINICEEVGFEIKMKMERVPDLAAFILALQEKDYDVALFDCSHIDEIKLNWVKVIRKIRPKIPLIIFSDNVNRKTGGKIYEEGTFYLCIRPVEINVLSKVLNAAMHMDSEKIKNRHQIKSLS